jgi:hypothetical protein
MTITDAPANVRIAINHKAPRYTFRMLSKQSVLATD